MSAADTLESLVDGLYAAATGDVPWQDWLHTLAVVLGSAATSLVYSEHGTWGGQFDLIVGTGYADAAPAEYAAHFAALDVRLPAVSRLAPGEVYHDGLQLPFATVEHSEIFSDFYGPQGIGRGMGLRLTGPGHGRGLIGVFRGLGKDSFSTAQGRTLQAIAPHLNRALSVHRRLSQAAALDLAAQSGLDRLRLPLIIVDATLRVQRMNAAADDLLRHPASPVTLRQGRLSATNDVAAAVAGACAGHAVPPPMLRIPYPDGSGSVAVLVSLVPPPSASGNGAPRLALVLMSDSRRQATVDTALLRAEFALTAAEAEVAASLLLGASVADIARRRTVSLETVRVQVKSLQLKTGCRSQAQLVAAFAQSLATALPSTAAAPDGQARARNTIPRLP